MSYEPRPLVVDKTTTALNLAFALAEKKHHRVLLIDLDGQASLTHTLMVGQSSSPTLLDHLTRGTSLAELAQPTRFEHIWLIPADERLTRLNVSSEHRSARELAFAHAIHSQLLTSTDGLPYDWIIFDTPPAQTFFTRIALAASHYIVLPITVETQAVWGVNRALDSIGTMHALMGRDVAPLGSLLTRWRQNPATRDNLATLLDRLRASGIPTFTTRIPEDAQVERAHLRSFETRRNNIFHLGGQLGPAANAYGQLVEEVLRHVHRN